MRNYWTCSKFADWIRGTTKIKCGTGTEWNEWEKAAKAKYPIRWWLAEEGLDKLQDIWCYIPERLNDVRYYINNRWVSKTHALTAHPSDIPRGEWRDVGNRFLPCLFNELVDFVEVEQAWHHCMWDEETRKKYRTPWWRSGWLRWRTWRCPEAGLDYLKWAMTLTNKDFIQEGEKEEPTYQAKAAKEILELYTWWKEVYPNRPDAMDASGWSAYCDAMRVKYPGSFLASLDSKDPEDRKASDKAHKLLRKIEAAYEKEDEAMMIRLIKIRDSLWT
jgi:hypothetical protein